FMTEEQRERHSVRPGLSGLAQVNGRNAISWENKLKYDLEYIQKITFRGDVKIILQTVMKAFVKQEGINREGTVSDMDFGDYLLQEEKVDQDKYDRLQ
ncbi:sugar transferase, partial [Clostridium perfringens]